VARGPGPQVGDDGRDLGEGVRPHEVHVGGGRCDLACLLRQPAEVERRAAPVGGAGRRRIEVEVEELAVERHRLAVEQPPEHLHRLEGASVPGAGGEALARQVARDDVHGESAVEHPVECGDLAGELGHPELAAAHGEQEVQPCQQRGETAGERGAVDTQRIARRQEHVVESVALGGEHDVAAVRPRRTQCGVGHTEKLVVVVAERGEPRVLGHGSGRPSDAAMMRYNSVRSSDCTGDDAAAASRSGFCVPSNTTGRAGCDSTNA